MGKTLAETQGRRERRVVVRHLNLYPWKNMLAFIDYQEIELRIQIITPRPLRLRASARV